MNKLIMFTDCYPYRPGGSFVANEMAYLCKNYDEIVLITTISKGENILYEVPTNVVLLPLYCINYKIEKLKAMEKGVKLLFKTNEEWNLTKTITEPSIKKKLYFCYIKALAEIRYSQCVKALDNIVVSNNDTITLYTYWFHYMNHVAIKLKQNIFKNALVVSRAHGGDLFEDRYPLGFSPLKKYCVKNSDRVFSCSRMGERYLKNLFPEYANKISFSYLGTNDYGLNFQQKGLKFRLLSCSSLTTVKRIDLIIKALSCLSGKDIKLEWIHFGDGELKASLTEFAKKYIPNNVSYRFMGEVTNMDLMDYYKNNYVDMFINLSSSEGIPVSIMEAMSFGIPVIATDVGGTRELVDKDSGYLVSKDINPEEISNIIFNYHTLSQTEIMLKRVNSRNNWARNFSAEANYNDFVKNKLR